MTVDGAVGRGRVVDSLRAELVGPDPHGPERDFTGAVEFATAKESYGPFTQAENGEEVLQRDAPTKRYGVGVLYPAAEHVPEELDPVGAPPEVDGGEAEAGEDREVMTKSYRVDVQRGAENVSAAAAAEAADDDFDLSGANEYRPSALAVTFSADLSQSPVLLLEVTGGRYLSKPVFVEGKERKWWLRRPVSATVKLEPTWAGSARSVERMPLTSVDLEGLIVEAFFVTRPQEDGTGLITVGVANRTRSLSSDEGSIFQAELAITFVSADGQPAILPYREVSVVEPDEEELSLELLYRNYPMFAVGHGCAADWTNPEYSDRISTVSGVAMPQYEAPSITADIRRADRSLLHVPMAVVAGIAGNDGLEPLRDVVRGYEEWIAEQETAAGELPATYDSTAKRHLLECRTALERMQEGLAYLETDTTVLNAFQLANEAVLLQQIRAGAKLRRLSYDARAKRVVHSLPRLEVDPLNPPSGRGMWRPFQIAFLLATIKSTALADHGDRELVDLIFFPTGGGKTEAYLGLSAFALFYRRLTSPTDVGTHVLMRYTLRLLTAQQFQRASALICAMETIRWRMTDKLGDTPFRIGIWVGSDTAPNTRAKAKEVLRALRRGDQFTENNLVVIRCPWCAAELGTLFPKGGKRPRGISNVVGYEESGPTVIIRCSDNLCEFADELPVVVIDEDIYELRPDIVIGTVDKFARLAWMSDPRALFGLDRAGTAIASPPGLIIQDELHLISGPLGSMVGLYEMVIDSLCTEMGSDGPLRPKIVSSTATIRRYQEQVRALFARGRTALFPPRGLDISDSYFARFARDEESGELRPGRLYVGVHGSGLGSMQTAQVRTFSALLQASRDLPDEAQRDPWWTLLAFFNSLRELGTSMSLLQSDIPDYLKTMKNRSGREWSEVRRLNELLELTGRLRSDEVPTAIRSLEVSTTDDGYPVDVCLASSIVEVGIDIDRLSLITVVGQPKTTSQYIQVSGRIGRRWWERPGLVVTIYGASKPRDRSHFERFRPYHERLYAQVEPTSVTPFSPPVLDRALHAVLISYVRQRGALPGIDSPFPMPQSLLESAREELIRRLEIVDPDEREELKRVVRARLDEWEHWERTEWVRSSEGGGSFLMREAGSYVEPRFRRSSWPVPSSLRNVDAECQAVITSLYSVEAAEESAGNGKS